MDKHIDITRCLNAFATLLQKGERSEKGYYYQGLWADSTDDGYTVRIFDQQCELTIYFHNKHQLSAPDGRTMDRFIKAIYSVADASH